MKARPCECGDCYLCAIFAASQGLPVKMPERQPTIAEFLAATDATGGKKSKKPRRPADDSPDLFGDHQE